MFGSEILDVALGVTLLFLLVSLICSAASEAFEGVLQHRGRNLERGIQELLQADSDRLEAFYRSPLIVGLFRGGYAGKARDEWWSWIRIWESLPRWWSRRSLPSYIPDHVFAAAICDIVTQRADAAPGSVACLRLAIEDFPEGPLKSAVQQALAHGGDDLTKVKDALKAWFNGSMDRVSGWYKRRSQLMLFLLGLAAAVVLNLDVITITQRLADDQALRKAVVAAAETVAKTEAERIAAMEEDAAQAAAADDAEPISLEAASHRIDALRGDIAAIGYPVGWEGGIPAPQRDSLCGAGKTCTILQADPIALARVALGWLVMALAVMLGAPFWFDTLNRIMVLRSTVKPDEKSRPEGSEDRRPR